MLEKNLLFCYYGILTLNHFNISPDLSARSYFYDMFRWIDLLLNWNWSKILYGANAVISYWSNISGLAFADLYQRCREAFLVNSDLTLRSQLTEFRDHKLIRTKKVRVIKLYVTAEFYEFVFTQKAIFRITLELVQFYRSNACFLYQSPQSKWYSLFENRHFCRIMHYFVKF